MMPRWRSTAATWLRCRCGAGCSAGVQADAPVAPVVAPLQVTVQAVVADAAASTSLRPPACHSWLPPPRPSPRRWRARRTLWLRTAAPWWAAAWRSSPLPHRWAAGCWPGGQDTRAAVRCRPEGCLCLLCVHVCSVRAGCLLAPTAGLIQPLAPSLLPASAQLEQLRRQKAATERSSGGAGQRDGENRRAGGAL